MNDLEELLDRLTAAVGDRDGAVALELFADDADTSLVTSEEFVARGREWVVRLFELYAEGDTTFSWQWDRREVAESGDVGWILATGVETMVGADHGHELPYRLTLVCERRDGRWLIRHFHGSSPVEE